MNDNNLMQYNGYQAIISYVGDSELFRGEVLGITGSVDFYSDSVEGLKKEFQKSIDMYLDVSKNLNVTP